MYDFIDGSYREIEIDGITDDEAVRFLPLDMARDFFRMKRSQGATVLEAMLEVLTACTAKYELINRNASDGELSSEAPSEP